MTITAKFPGTCSTCGGPVSPGQRVEWDKAAKTVAHHDCAQTERMTATHEENAPLSFSPTMEQVTALELFSAGDALAIEAGAGTGKTSTLKLLAESTNRRGQYVFAGQYQQRPAQQGGQQAALVGGGEEVVRFAKGADELMVHGRTDHPELACFESWGEVQMYVSEDEQGGELRLLVKLVDEFGVPTILDALDKTIREEDADVVVSTAHKSKGREWDAVQLAGDFPAPESGNLGEEELRLLYVASTRAKRELDIEAVEALRSDLPGGNGGGNSSGADSLAGAEAGSQRQDGAS